MDDVLYILISSYVVAVICMLLLPERMFPKRKHIKKQSIFGYHDKLFLISGFVIIVVALFVKYVVL